MNHVRRVAECLLFLGLGFLVGTLILSLAGH